MQLYIILVVVVSTIVAAIFEDSLPIYRQATVGSQWFLNLLPNQTWAAKLAETTEDSRTIALQCKLPWIGSSFLITRITNLDGSQWFLNLC